MKKTHGLWPYLWSVYAYAKMYKQNKYKRPINTTGGHLNYLGCDISYNDDNDTENKFHKLQFLCGPKYRLLRN